MSKNLIIKKERKDSSFFTILEYSKIKNKSE